MCVCVCVCEWGLELNFRVHSSQGGELGGKDGKGILFTTLLGTVVLCLSVQVYMLGEIFRSAMRAEIKKSLLVGSPLSLLTYLRIGNHPFPGRGFGELCITIGHVPVCLSVGSFVRSLVCLLLLLLSADEDMGLRIEQSRRSSLTQVPLSLIAGTKKNEATNSISAVPDGVRQVSD